MEKEGGGKDEREEGREKAWNENIRFCTIALISHSSKVMLKILPARLQQYVNCEAGFRRGRGTRDQIANIRWIMEKGRVSEKYLFLLD